MTTPKSALSEYETPPISAQMVSARVSDRAPEESAAESSQRALLNILEDFAAEKSGLEHGQRAMLIQCGELAQQASDGGISL